MFKNQEIAGKILASLFWDTGEIIVTNYLKLGRNITSSKNSDNKKMQYSESLLVVNRRREDVFFSKLAGLNKN